MNHSSCNALVTLQDRGYLRRNIENTSTRKQCVRTLPSAYVARNVPDDGVSDDHSAVFRLTKGSKAFAGGDLKDRRRRRGRCCHPRPGSRLSLLQHPGSAVSRHRSEGLLGRSRPGCTGPVQRNTQNRGGGSVSSALHTYLSDF